MIGVALAAVPLPLLAQPAPLGVFVARDGDNSVIIVSGRISPETETASRPRCATRKAGHASISPAQVAPSRLA
jgi:hypothetical protein